MPALPILGLVLISSGGVCAISGYVWAVIDPSLTVFYVTLGSQTVAIVGFVLLVAWYCTQRIMAGLESLERAIAAGRLLGMVPSNGSSTPEPVRRGRG